MFRIPSFYEMPKMTFEEAKAVFAGDMLKGMKQIDEQWERHCAGDSMFDDDDDFFDTWQYEVNAYNVVYTTMKPLFV